MSGQALAVGGWIAALLAGTAAWLAARLLRAQREAVVRAAHELRGPLTAIGLGIELSRRAGPGGEHGDSWRGLELELARARLALEDLGGGSRGARLERLERIALDGLVADCVAAARGPASVAGVAVRGAWSGPAAFVWGDRLRLAQALGNLIANAIEHGGGVVTVSGGGPVGVGGLAGLGGGPAGVGVRGVGGAARIEVVDRGPGLPASVADLAARARGGRGRRGRGLAIADEIVRQHRGRLASAPASCGARLVLELPATSTEQAELG